MSDSMHPIDEQLIQLLREKSAEELSFEELDQLRVRLAQSPALRAALAEYLQTESYLAQILGESHLSPDALIARAQAEQAAEKASAWQWVAGGLLCLLLVGVLVSVFINALQPPSNDIAEVKVEDQDNHQSDPDAAIDPQPPLNNQADPAESPADPNDSPENPAGQPPDAGETPAPGKVQAVLWAESFVRGDVVVDNSKLGTVNDIVIHSEGQNKRSAEYSFNLPAAGEYYVHVRYASGDARPISAIINYKRPHPELAGAPTGGFKTDHLAWSTAGPFPFKKGKNNLKLSRAGPWPSINCLVISSDSAISDAVVPRRSVDAVAAAEPWDVYATAAPLTFAEVAFGSFATDKSLPQKEDLLRWFENVPGANQQFREAHTKLGRCGEFEGVVRLRWPWQENAALRLSLENYNRLQIHLYHGNQGVTLAYYEDPLYCWGAYATTRENNTAFEPRELALTATDDGRCGRTEIRFGGPFDLRWHDGEVILSRGDIVLLRAPLAGAPQDVFLQGRAAFHGIAIVPTSDAPPREPELPLVQEITRPADLDWFEKLAEGAQFTKHDDGSVELVSNDAKDRGFVSAPLPIQSPSEVIVELSNVTPGASIYLAGKERSTFAWLRVAKNTRMNPPALCVLSRRDDAREGDFGSWAEQPVTLIRPERLFVKLLAGAGVVRTAISVDGIHWADWDGPEPGLPPGLSHLLLECVPHAPDCRMRVNRITIRRLPAFYAQTTPELLTQAPVLFEGPAARLDQWLADVVTSQPAGVDADLWRRTCAIRALAAGCEIDLGQRLVAILLDDVDAQDISPAEKLAFYQEAFALLNTRHDWNVNNNSWKRYFQLSQQAFQQHGLRPFSFVRPAMMTSPVSWRYRFEWLNPEIVRLELVQLLYSSRWDEALDLCQQLRYFRPDLKDPLVAWAEATAVRQAPGRAGGDVTLSRLDASWRPVLVEELSKDTYNALAELQAVLDSDAYDDAARMISSISPDTVIGVAPQGRDRQLLVSLPAAIRLAMHQYPQLQRVLSEKHGSLGELRVRQSINENNVAAVELAAVQFEGTTAASEAHRWLGDRALASGFFSRAIAEYDRALRHASSGSKHDLLARKRLASAMLGKPQGEPVTRPVAFGETLMSPAEFESIVADMQRVNAAVVDRAIPVPQSRVFSAPPAQGFAYVSRGNLDGPLGQEPNNEVTRDLNRYGVGWCERQLATVVNGQTLYVSNRFQVAAYNLENWQKLWQTTDLPGNKMRARDWSLIPMRPLVTGKFVFVRLLYGSGPVLACFERENGKLVWSGEQQQNEFLVSDPLLIQDELVGLTLVRVEQGQSILRLTTFDMESGEPLVNRNLLRINDVWWTRHTCEVTALDDAVVATLSGLTLCCDLAGEVRWIRKHVALPPDTETSWVKQFFERPLVTGTRVLLTQPGVRSLDCVDADTGRLCWSHVIPDIESLIGVQENRAIVRTENAFLAFDVETGERLWSHSRPAVFDAALLGGEGGFVYVEKSVVKDHDDRFFPTLVWLDPATGQAQASFALPALEDPQPHFGPLVRWNERMFAFWGRGNEQPNRELLEFRPQASLPIQRYALAQTDDPWGRYASQPLRDAVRKQFPDWSLLAAKKNDDSGWHAEQHGEQEVVNLGAARQSPILLTRQIAPPAESHPKVRLRLNQVCDSAGCKVQLYFQGALLAEQVVEQKTQRNWKDLEFDLSAAAGKSGVLNLVVVLDGNGEMSTFWKQLQYVP